MRTSLSRRFVLPGAVIGATVIGSLMAFGVGASASSSGSSSTPEVVSSTITGAQKQEATTTSAGSELKGAIPVSGEQTTSPNSGTPNSSYRIFRNGSLVAYGNRYITYVAPPKSLIPLGEALYQQNCASCHGTEANGVAASGTPGGYPNLRGLGPATITFWIDSGRMPAKNTTLVQALRKPASLTPVQALAVAAWVNSLDPSVPYIPVVHTPHEADVSNGFALFALNCAACHTITGDGDALAENTYAPSLRNIPANQVAMAIRTGPGNMPRFTGNLSDGQVRDIVGYVVSNIQHPYNPGGFGLGGLGPVAEGFVGLLLGVGILALVAFWIGDRT